MLKRKRSHRYHHGNLRQALLEEAVRTIQTDGVDQLTLRAVGDRLGVSRTALYRHFSDKHALVAAVAREGFRMLRLALTAALDEHGRERKGFEAMAVAYIHFAVEHPSHYRVMFGHFVESCSKNAELAEQAAAAFEVLVDSLIAQQQAGLIRQDDPVMLAEFIWSVVHGVAMLVIERQLRGDDDRGEGLNQYAVERIRDAITVA
jgi:AcrR family transcriptional regulator